MKKRLLSLLLALTMLTISGEIYASASENEEVTILKKYDLVNGTTELISIGTNSAVQRGSARPHRSTSYFPTENIEEIEEASTRAIIGTDTRVQIHSTTVRPYYAVAQLKMEYENGRSGWGTGYMISSNVMLTAGHCCMSKSNSPATSITVYLGKNGDYEPLTTYVTSYYVCANFDSYNDPARDDYAILILNSDVGNTTGWFGISYEDDEFFDDSSKYFTIAGYPGDGDKLGTMWMSRGQITNYDTYTIDYNIDMYGGQSGAPVYCNLGSNDYVAYGINVEEYTTYNRGRRMTQELFDWLYDNEFVQ